MSNSYALKHNTQQNIFSGTYCHVDWILETDVSETLASSVFILLSWRETHQASPKRRLLFTVRYNITAQQTWICGGNRQLHRPILWPLVLVQSTAKRASGGSKNTNLKVTAWPVMQTQLIKAKISGSCAQLNMTCACLYSLQHYPRLWGQTLSVCTVTSTACTPNGTDGGQLQTKYWDTSQPRRYSLHTHTNTHTHTHTHTHKHTQTWDWTRFSGDRSWRSAAWDIPINSFTILLLTFRHRASSI